MDGGARRTFESAPPFGSATGRVEGPQLPVLCKTKICIRQTSPSQSSARGAVCRLIAGLLHMSSASAQLSNPAQAIAKRGRRGAGGKHLKGTQVRDKRGALL